MREVTILLFCYSHSNKTSLVLDTIRKYNGIDSISVVLVDCSMEGIWEWGQQQTDITYVYMDEENKHFGYMLNQLKEQLQIQTDLLIMSDGFLIAPDCLGKMLKVLGQEKVGAVGPKSNVFFGCQRLEEKRDYWVSEYYDCISEHIDEKRVLGLQHQFLLLKREMIEALGNFDEEFESAKYCMKDYELRMIRNDWKIKVCLNAYTVRVEGNPEYTNELQEAKLLEEKWGMHYFNVLYNGNLIQCMKQNREDSFSVLEIGCDCGATLLEIQNQFPNATVYGCELNEKAAEIASKFCEAIVGNIEEQQLPYEEKFFDYIIFGDVLEHLRDPLKAIIYCRDLLKDGGKIIASIPNLMHISVVAELLKGNFTYTETGLLDKTHVHFFTYNEIIKMFQQAHYDIRDLFSITMPMDEKQQVVLNSIMNLDLGAQRFMYETFQYVVMAEKK